MSEIVYEETSKGHFEPRPFAHQRKASRDEARAAEERRQNRLTLFVYIPLAALGLIAWIAFNFFVAGGRL